MCQRDKGGGCHRSGGQEIEVPNPGTEYRSHLTVEIDGQCKKHVLRDEEADLTGEGYPCKVIEELNQRGVPVWTEGGEQPEEVRHAK